MLKPKNIIVYLVLMTLMACGGGKPVKSQWSPVEKLERFQNQTHHWGQKGETRPNKGWADYTFAKLTLDEKNHMTFRQKNRELSVIYVYEKGPKGGIQIVDIPGAGFFVSPKENGKCTPDRLEASGLALEHNLFLLAKAFPGGPDSVTQSSTASAQGGPVELRFIQGVLLYKSSWEIQADAKILNPKHFNFEIYFDGDPYTSLEWNANGKEEVIPNDESLEGWLACWSSAKNIETGETVFELPNHKDLKTFGEVRAAVKANRSD